MPLAEPRSAVAAWPTKPVAVAWAKNVPIPTSIRPTITAKRLGSSKRGSPSPASARALQNVGRVPNRRAAERRGQDRWQKYEIDKAESHAAEQKRLADKHEVYVGESADEGEQDAKSDAEAGQQWRIAQMLGPNREGFRRSVLEYRHGGANRKINQHRARKIESREKIKVGGQAEIISHGG